MRRYETAEHSVAAWHWRIQLLSCPPAWSAWERKSRLPRRNLSARSGPKISFPVYTRLLVRPMNCCCGLSFHFSIHDGDLISVKCRGGSEISRWQVSLSRCAWLTVALRTADSLFAESRLRRYGYAKQN